MKRIISALLVFIFALTSSSSAFAMVVLHELVDVTTPTSKYVYVVRATLEDTSMPGYLTLSVSSTPQVMHDYLEIFKNTYGKAAKIPKFSKFIPGAKLFNYAPYIMKMVDRMCVTCYMRLNDTQTGEVIWDGQWIEEDGDDCPFTDGKVIYLGNDHPAYDLYFKSPNSISFTFIQLSIAENIVWTNPS